MLTKPAIQFPPFDFLKQKEEFLILWNLGYIEFENYEYHLKIIPFGEIPLSQKGEGVYEAICRYLLLESEQLVPFLRSVLQHSTGRMNKYSEIGSQLELQLNDCWEKKDLANTICLNELILLCSPQWISRSSKPEYKVNDSEAYKFGQKLLQQWDLEEAFFTLFQLLKNNTEKEHVTISLQRLFSQIQCWLFLKWMKKLDGWDKLSVYEVIDIETATINYSSGFPGTVRMRARKTEGIGEQLND